MALVRSDDDEISAINVTPLVDVVLVLLVIFMITAPVLYQSSLNVQLPPARSGEDQAKTTLRIEVDRTGVLFVEGKRTTYEEIGRSLQQQRVTEAIVLGDKQVEHGKVVALIDFLKSNGIQKVSLGVERVE